jgi:hypothetical protein
MSDMRHLLSLLDENIQVEDSFDLEISEDLLIETGVVGLTEDGIIVEADEEMLGLLEAAGLELDEGDILKGPWSGTQGQLPLDTSAPKAPVVPLPTAPKFEIVKLYKEFVGTPQYRQAARKPMDDDAFMTLASEYIESKMGKVHPRVLGQFADKMLTVHKTNQKQGQMFEIDELDEVAKLAGLNWNDPNVRAHFDKPTVARVAGGETEPVDRTDYDVPPAMRTSTAGMTGPEIRRQSLIKQGILKATKEELDVEECGYDLNPRVMAEGPGDEPAEPDMDSDDKRWDDVEDETVDEAKYQGREVPLGKPMAGDVKKSKVYVRKPNGKVVKVNFGDKNMRIKKSNPGRRKNFRARHNCKNPGPRWKARYWSCRAW